MSRRTGRSVIDLRSLLHSGERRENSTFSITKVKAVNARLKSLCNVNKFNCAPIPLAQFSAASSFARCVTAVFLGTREANADCSQCRLLAHRIGNLRAVQLLLGHTKIESTVRYLGIEVDDALAIAGQVEPSLGLAPAIINELFDILAELRDDGKTIFLVDQMAALALTVADRGFVLESGRLVQSGSAEMFMNDPQLEAAYLGKAERVAS